jgi:hypothetical protein
VVERLWRRTVGSVYDHDPEEVEVLGWEEFIARQWEQPSAAKVQVASPSSGHGVRCCGTRLHVARVMPGPGGGVMVRRRGSA